MGLLDQPPLYRSYLLTLWEERRRDSDLPVVWRFGLQEAHIGQRRAFATVGALVAALEQEMAGACTDEHEQGRS
jgi:hypothetical protein